MTPLTSSCSPGTALTSSAPQSSSASATSLDFTSLPETKKRCAILLLLSLVFLHFDYALPGGLSAPGRSRSLVIPGPCRAQSPAAEVFAIYRHAANAAVPCDHVIDQPAR